MIKKLLLTAVVAFSFVLPATAQENGDNIKYWVSCPDIPRDDILWYNNNTNVDITFMVHINDNGEILFWAYGIEEHVVREDGFFKGIPVHKSKLRKLFETMGQGMGDDGYNPDLKRWR